MNESAVGIKYLIYLINKFGLDSNPYTRKKATQLYKKYLTKADSVSNPELLVEACIISRLKGVTTNEEYKRLIDDIVLNSKSTKDEILNMKDEIIRVVGTSYRGRRKKHKGIFSLKKYNDSLEFKVEDLLVDNPRFHDLLREYCSVLKIDYDCCKYLL